MPISPQPLIEFFPKFENNLPPYFLFSKQNFRTICACTHARGAQSMIVHAQTLHEHNHNHDKCSCVHAHEQIIQKINLENRKYVGSLSLKFEKDLLHGCGEVCLSLAMHVYLQFFFVFSAIFQVQGAKHTNC